MKKIRVLLGNSLTCFVDDSFNEKVLLSSVDAPNRFAVK